MLIGTCNETSGQRITAGRKRTDPVVQTAMLGQMPFQSLRHAMFTHRTTAEGLTSLVADVEEKPRAHEYRVWCWIRRRRASFRAGSFDIDSSLEGQKR